ncbi:SpvB/TcaC N-terminal domain-containing protein [Eionea flava]
MLFSYSSPLITQRASIFNRLLSVFLWLSLLGLLFFHSSVSAKDRLFRGEQLGPDSILESSNCRYRLHMQLDGNLVLRNQHNTPLFDTKTAGQGRSYFVFQSADGNLVTYRSNGSGSSWAPSPNISVNTGTQLILQEDGNLVLRRANNSVVWASNTGQPSSVPTNSLCSVSSPPPALPESEPPLLEEVYQYPAETDYSGTSNASDFSGYEENPDTVGNVAGEFAVSGGQVSYSVPIQVAPGRGGMQPDLSVNYSGSGNGILGVGWSLGGVSSIHRCAPTLDQDGFIDTGITFGHRDRYCLDGQRLIAINGSDGGVGTEYRTEVDSYTQIISYGGTTHHPNHWVVKTKAGQVLTFGGNDDARVSLASKGTLSWSVRELNDSTSNNPVTYHYKNAQLFENVQYLDKITYNGGRVAFNYEEREDITRGYVLGHERVNRYRLHSVDVYVHDHHLNRYLPHYAYEGFHGASTLRSLKQCNSDGECLPELRFIWQEAQEGWVESSDYRLPYQTNIDNEADMGSRFVDVNGDGLLDYVYYRYVDGEHRRGAYINTGSGWRSEDRYKPKYHIATNNRADLGVRFMDINGDGLLDQIYHRYISDTEQQKGAYLNTGNGWEGDNRYGPAYHISADNNLWGDLGSRFIDLNGDGLVDQIYSYLDSALTTHSGAFLNNGNGWNQAPAYKLPEHHIATDSNNTDLGIRFIDINGDGLVDYLYHRLTFNGQVQKGAYLNTGSGWKLASDYTPPYFTAMDDQGDIESADDDRYDAGSRFVDINGDGLLDMVYHRLVREVVEETAINAISGQEVVQRRYTIFTSEKGAYLNTGEGWITSPAIKAQYTPRQPIAKDGVTDLGSRFVDINGDGLTDQVFHRLVNFDPLNIQKGAYLNTASGWKRNDAYTPAFHIAGDGHTGGDYGSQFVDINGDGFVDQVVFRSIFLDGRVEHQQHTYLNQTRQKHLLTKIIDSNRLETALQYGYLTDPSIYTPYTGSQYPVYDIAAPILVVSDVTTDNGVGGQTTVSYRYEGLRAHMRGRGSYGYKKITEHYPDTGKSIETVFNHDAFPKTGNVEKRIERYNGQVVNESQTVLTTVKKAAFDHFTYQLHLDHSIESSYELNGEKVVTIHTVHEHVDPYGNIGKLTVHTSGADGQRFTKETLSEYDNNTYRWYLGRLTQSTVTHTAPYQLPVQRRSQFEYDAERGLLTAESVMNVDTGNPIITKTYSHNNYGQRISVRSSVVGEADTLSTMEYNNLGRLVKGCNSLNECVSNSYTKAGDLASVTDINGLITQWVYDDFGRQTEEHRADGTSTKTAIHFASSGYCGDLAEHAYTCTITEVTGTQPSIVQQDRLGRTVRTLNTGFDGRLIYSDTQYNHLAQPARVSRPYFSGDHTYWAISEYDVLGRVTKVDEPSAHGTRTMAETRYNGLETVVISGEEDREKLVRTNAIGQTIYREEELGSYVEYTYTADGNLKTTTVAGDSDTTVTLYYDAFGRKIKMDDPDMGIWTYDYNAYGQLISQTDAKGQTTIMEYDILDRMIARYDGDGGMTTWEYGSLNAPAGSRGKLLNETHEQADGGGISKTYFYDSLGRIEETQVTIDPNLPHANSFSTQLAYDSLGRLSRTLYPGSDNFYTENLYNDNGFLTKVRGLRSNSEHYNLDQLLPLISDAVDFADEFLVSAARLRGIGEAYQWRINDLRSLTAGGNYGNVLADHESALEAVIAKADNTTVETHTETSVVESDMFLAYKGMVIPMTARQTIETQHQTLALDEGLLEHVNHTIIELETVRALIAKQAGSYEDSAEQLIILAEQTLAAADNHFQYARTLNRGADAYTELVNDNQYTTYWQVLDVDASGRTSAEVYGNGVVNDYTYNQATGELQQIHSGLLSISPLKHLEYQYDGYKNVTTRHDHVNDIQEDFYYDRLDRLTRTDIASQLYPSTAFNGSQTQEYDVHGNITYKSDVGHYTYGNGIASGAGIHAVIATTPTDGGSAGNAGAVTTYQYDANGNMVSGDGRTLAWSSFNKPTLMTKDGRSAAFSYGGDRSRYKKVNHLGDTTLYIGQLYERLTKGGDGSVDEKHYIYAGGSLVAEHIVSTAAGVQTRYLHKDALGSIDLVTDAYANVVDRRSFDAWGQLRNLPWKDSEGINNPLYLTQLPFTNKAYTGHENIQEVDLIHMNGRVYDARLARFMSADPHIQEGALTQSYNRYSYVMNNPLKYTDPSGYFWKKISKIFRALARVPILNAIAQIAACYFGGPAGCAAYAAVSTYAVTGKFGQALKAGITALVTAEISSAIGSDIAGSFGETLGKAAVTVGKTTIDLGRATAHAVVSGTINVLHGGKFGASFAASFFTKIISSPIQGFADKFGSARELVGASLAAISGGTISKLGGGKFGNGAATAAIQYLYNQAGSNARTAFAKKLLVDYLNARDQDAWSLDDGFLYVDLDDSISALDDSGMFSIDRLMAVYGVVENNTFSRYAGEKDLKEHANEYMDVITRGSDELLFYNTDAIRLYGFDGLVYREIRYQPDNNVRGLVTFDIVNSTHLSEIAIKTVVDYAPISKLFRMVPKMPELKLEK